MASPVELFMDRLRILADPGRNSPDTDGQLLARWAVGRDERAFAALVGRHGALVWRVGRSVLQQPEEAEDVFQAAFLILAQKAAGLQSRSSIAGWLYQTAYRLACKSRAAKARRVRRENAAAHASASDPLEEISVREARAILGEELERLPAKYREPLLLCLYEGATQDEAARRLGYSHKTLVRRLERGRALLGRRLAHRGLAPGSALALTLYANVTAPVQAMHRTVTAALQFVSGQATTGTATLLAQGTLRAWALKKTAIYGALFLAAASLTAGGLAWSLGSPGKTPEKSQSEVVKVRARLADVGGAALPIGAISRIGSNRLRQGGRIVRLQHSPDAKALAATSESYLYLWDMTTGKPRWRHPRSSDYYSDLAFSGDGRKVALLNSAEYLVIATDTGKVLARHEWSDKNDDATRCLAIAPDLGAFARGCVDATVRIYDGASGKEKLRLVAGAKAERQLPNFIAFSADSKTIYVAADRKAELVAFDTKTGKIAQTVPTAINSELRPRLSLSSKRRWLAILQNDQIILTDLQSGQARKLTFEPDAQHVPRFRMQAAFFPDDRLLAVGGDNPSGIVLFDTTTAKERFRLRGRATAFDFAPDGKTLAAADDTGCITVWDLATGKTLPPSPEPRGLGFIRFTRDGKDVWSVADEIGWWDVTSGKPTRSIPWAPKWHDGYLPALTRDGKLLAAYMTDGSLMIVDALTGKPLRTANHDQVNSVSFSSERWKKVNAVFSPDASKLFLSTASGPLRGQGERVRILDVATGQVIGELPTNSRWVHRIAVSPDGRWLASAGMEVKKGKVPFGFGGKGGKASTGGGKATTGEYRIQVWDTTTGSLAHRLKPASELTLSLGFSPDSAHLVSVAAKRSEGPSSGPVQLWNVASGKEVRTFAANQAGALCAVFSPDGRMVAGGGKDKLIHLWEVATGQERAHIAGHESAVFSLDFAPDGRFLAAASNDAPVYLWKVFPSPKAGFPAAKLTNDDRDKLWNNLAGPDSATAFQAMCQFIARPEEAVSVLEEGWKRQPRATAKQIQKWLDDLYSDDAAVRTTAGKDLERFASRHEDLLRQALKQTGALAVRQRLEKILDRPDGERLRASRMLEVLEQLGTPAARRLLQALSEQHEEAATAREAAAGLRRLQR